MHTLNVYLYSILLIFSAVVSSTGRYIHLRSGFGNISVGLLFYQSSICMFLLFLITLLVTAHSIQANYVHMLLIFLLLTLAMTMLFVTFLYNIVV
jgi:hypothetical protein